MPKEREVQTMNIKKVLAVLFGTWAITGIISWGYWIYFQLKYPYETIITNAEGMKQIVIVYSPAGPLHEFMINLLAVWLSITIVIGIFALVHNYFNPSNTGRIDNES